MTHNTSGDHDPIDAAFERELDHAFAGPSSAPPSQFLSRVQTRHHRVVAARLGAVAALGVVVLAVVFWARPIAKPSLDPVIPVIARGSGSTDFPLMIGSHGQGSDDPDVTPSGDTRTPRIRMGDGLESEAVRALLAA